MTTRIPLDPLTSEELTALVDGLAGLPYGGEAVDQRTHALQTAWLAMERARTTSWWWPRRCTTSAGTGRARPNTRACRTRWRAPSSPAAG
ncbi:hypothetical protein M271_48470 [Streptomyces rapamycinicus NRRL 5491]|nr:hypothetical protein M271_48470 [Streptomyces rapamycinicus NRRL 5491]